VRTALIALVVISAALRRLDELTIQAARSAFDQRDEVAMRSELDQKIIHAFFVPLF